MSDEQQQRQDQQDAAFTAVASVINATNGVITGGTLWSEETYRETIENAIEIIRNASKLPVDEHDPTVKAIWNRANQAVEASPEGKGQQKR